MSQVFGRGADTLARATLLGAGIVIVFMHARWSGALDDLLTRDWVPFAR